MPVDGGVKPGEVILRKMVVLQRRPKGERLESWGNLVLLVLLFPVLLSGIDFLHKTYLLVVVLWALWIMFKFLKRILSADFSELVITNQRLLLRSGTRLKVWVSNYESAIEVLTNEDYATVVIRPTLRSCAPEQVYVKTSEPSRYGSELIELLLSVKQTSFVSAAIPVGGTVGSAKAPPGIVVTHAFLCSQLRTFIAAIPLPSFAQVDFGSSQLPPLIQLSEDSKSSSDLGATGYQFGVDQQS
ncbi:MAG: hypothetical protein C0508_27980 [Cyanobacteria bacterium PR.023]|nr:hypothetical protein [Cyanobacteria bacterium PR.023]